MDKTAAEMMMKDSEEHKTERLQLNPEPPYGRNMQLLRMLGLAIAVGILGALAVLAFHQLLLVLESAIYGLNQGLVADAARLPPEIRVITPAAGGLVAGIMLQYFLKRKENGADYMEAITAGSEIPLRS